MNQISHKESVDDVLSSLFEAATIGKFDILIGLETKEGSLVRSASKVRFRDALRSDVEAAAKAIAGPILASQIPGYKPYRDVRGSLEICRSGQIWMDVRDFERDWHCFRDVDPDDIVDFPLTEDDYACAYQRKDLMAALGYQVVDPGSDDFTKGWDRLAPQEKVYSTALSPVIFNPFSDTDDFAMMVPPGQDPVVFFKSIAKECQLFVPLEVINHNSRFVETA